MSRQFWMETLAWATASGSAIATTATETIIFPNITIPANYVADGRALRLSLWGNYGNQAVAETMTLRIRWGGVAGTVLAASGAMTLSSSAMTAAQWHMEAILQCRANGSSGTIFTQGRCEFWTNTAPTSGTVTNYGMSTPMCSAGQSTPAAVTVDLTADTALSVTAQHGTSNASNTLTGNLYIIEACN